MQNENLFALRTAHNEKKQRLQEASKNEEYEAFLKLRDRIKEKNVSELKTVQLRKLMNVFGGPILMEQNQD